MIFCYWCSDTEISIFRVDNFGIVAIFFLVFVKSIAPNCNCWYGNWLFNILLLFYRGDIRLLVIQQFCVDDLGIILIDCCLFVFFSLCFDSLSVIHLCWFRFDVCVCFTIIRIRNVTDGSVYVFSMHRIGRIHFGCWHRIECQEDVGIFAKNVFRIIRWCRPEINNGKYEFRTECVCTNENGWIIR